jgi:hypothetical protein
MFVKWKLTKHGNEWERLREGRMESALEALLPTRSSCEVLADSP